MALKPTVQKIDCRDKYLANGKLWMHAVCADGFVAGSLSITVDRGFAWINDLFVKDLCRRNGIGRLLVENAVNLLAHDGLKGACAGIDEDNKPSIALFEGIGFRHVFDYPDTHVRLYSLVFGVSNTGEIHAS